MNEMTQTPEDYDVSQLDLLHTMRSHLCMIPTIVRRRAISMLWPLSGGFHTKPFIRLSNRSSLLQKAYLRCEQMHESFIRNIEAMP
jgi:hypothetical protein